MAQLTYGTETIEEGATLWRLIINTWAALLDSIRGTRGTGSKYNQTPVGTIDGVNLSFTTPDAEAYVADSLRIHYNGMRVPASNYAETDPDAGSFAFASGKAPATGSTLEIDYHTP